MLHCICLFGFSGLLLLRARTSSYHFPLLALSAQPCKKRGDARIDSWKAALLGFTCEHRSPPQGLFPHWKRAGFDSFGIVSLIVRSHLFGLQSPIRGTGISKAEEGNFCHGKAEPFLKSLSWFLLVTLQFQFCDMTPLCCKDVWEMELYGLCC